MLQRQMRPAAVGRQARWMAITAVAAGLLLGAAVGPASAATSTPFEVCSPLGCYQQRTAGTIRWGTTSPVASTIVVGSATDSAPAVAFLVVVEFSAKGRITRHEFTVDNGTKSFNLTGLFNTNLVRISACAGNPIWCNVATFKPFG